MDNEGFNEQELLSCGYRKYRGQEIDVYFSLSACAHSGKCIFMNKKVFNLKHRPWIDVDNDDALEVIRTVNNCPSGALKFIKKSK